MPYKEGDKWRAKVTYQGQRYTRLKGTKTEALDWESEKRRKLKENAKSLPSGPDLLSLCSKYVIYAERFSKKTHGEKKTVCKMLLAALGGDTLIADITPGDIQTYIDDQARIRTANAANKDRKNLHALWEYGRRFMGLATNPVSITTKWSHERRPQYVPPVEDVLKVLAAADRKERIFLDAYLQTGARRSSVLRWTWHADINFKEQKVRIGHRKTKDGSMTHYWLGMSEELYQSLWWLWNNRKFKKSLYVFVCEHKGRHYGKHFTEHRHFMRNLCDRAKVKRFGFQAIRRFVASLLDDQKVPLKKIQLILGHSQPTTTDRYLYNLRGDRDLRETMNKLSLVKFEKAHEAGTNKKG